MTLKFEILMDPKHIMAEYLKVMLTMIYNLKIGNNNLRDNQHMFTIVISIPHSWVEALKVDMRHIGNINTLDDISHNLELEANLVMGTA